MNPSIVALTDTVIAYVSSHQVVVYDTVEKTQRYIQGKTSITNPCKVSMAAKESQRWRFTLTDVTWPSARKQSRLSV